MADSTQLLRKAMPREGQSARSSGDSSPWLAFVSGDLGELTGFVRHGLRLASFATGSAPLMIGERLGVSEGWGGSSRVTPYALNSSVSCDAKETSEGSNQLPSLRVWRVVLAICWQESKDMRSGSSQAPPSSMPAFIIDYCIEKLSAQLGYPA